MGKNLVLKRIQKRHAKNPQDKELHEIIETGDANKEAFDKTVDRATKQKPFDKKKS